LFGNLRGGDQRAVVIAFGQYDVLQLSRRADADFLQHVHRVSGQWLVASFYKKIFYSLLIILNLVVLIATVSKAAILGFLVMAIIFAGKYFLKNRKLKLR
jgi:hypothetical protein